MGYPATPPHRRGQSFLMRLVINVTRYVEIVTLSEHYLLHGHATHPTFIAFHIEFLLLYSIIISFPIPHSIKHPVTHHDPFHHPGSVATSSRVSPSLRCSFPNPSVTPHPSQNSVRWPVWYVSLHLCPHLTHWSQHLTLNSPFVVLCRRPRRSLRLLWLFSPTQRRTRSCAQSSDRPSRGE